MSLLVIGGIVVCVYVVVGLFGYALCKTAGDADRAIKAMFDNEIKEGPCT